MIGYKSRNTFEIDTGSYGGKSEANSVVKSSEMSISSIKIFGKRSKDIDNAVFEDISTHYSETTTSLTLKFMELDIDNIAVFGNLKELTLYYCDLSFSFVKFDQWCPNLTKLEIKNIDFYNFAWYDDWIVLTEYHKSPQLRSLSLEVGIDNLLAYFKLMEIQFPLLESLFLGFGTKTNFTAGRTLLSRFSRRIDRFLTEMDSTYQSVYFNNLKKLKISACGQCEEIFNFLKISNQKLTEVEFCGTKADDILIHSLYNFPKLTKLTLDCPYVEEVALNRLPEHLTKLRDLTLNTKYLYWIPSSIVKFLEDGHQLRRLHVKVYRKNHNFRIDDTVKKRFEALVEAGRRFLQLNIEFFESSHSIELSRNGLLDNLDEIMGLGSRLR